MPAGSVAVKERHQPLVLVDTAGLSEEEWLAYRRKGIGGSDVAALLGISPWRTARDLFYDKLNIAVVEDHEDNWVALEMGHLLEPTSLVVVWGKFGGIMVNSRPAKRTGSSPNTSSPSPL